jgi:S-adenosylmethionine hydrolase
MPIITLTSDFSLTDPYVAALKGTIYSHLPNVNIVDISHFIGNFNLLQTAFTVKNACFYFPEKTVHFITVSAERQTNQSYIILEYKNHYFVAPDNGILFLMFGDEIRNFYTINQNEIKHPTFNELAIANILTTLAVSHLPNQFGEKLIEPQRLTPYLPNYYADTLIGNVLYIDTYGNAITNIDKVFFERSANGRKFVIETTSKTKIREIKKHYSDVVEGELVALFNASGLLEIAVRNGLINRLFNLRVADSIKIIFE